MEKNDFIDLLTSCNSEEINKLLEEKGKKKPRAMVCLLPKISNSSNNENRT